MRTSSRGAMSIFIAICSHSQTFMSHRITDVVYTGSRPVGQRVVRVPAYADVLIL